MVCLVINWGRVVDNNGDIIICYTCLNDFTYSTASAIPSSIIEKVHSFSGKDGES